MGEPEKALAVLQEGMDETEDRELRKLYARIEEQMQQASHSDMDDANHEERNTEDAGNDMSEAADGSYVRSGNYVIFGSYEQDGNAANGSEPIEWEVLDETDGKLFLISRYILDRQPYNTEFKGVTWENCTLRSWLNNEFCNAAFSAAEQGRIVTVNLSNPDNAYSGTEGGSDTFDKIFCMSVDEILDYYSFNSWHEEYQYGYIQRR